MKSRPEAPFKHPKLAALTAFAQIVIAAESQKTPEMYEIWLRENIGSLGTTIQPDQREAAIKTVVKDYAIFYGDWVTKTQPETKQLFQGVAHLVCFAFIAFENRKLNENPFQNVYELLHKSQLALIQQ